MFRYYDEYNQAQSCQPLSISDFLRQPYGELSGWFNEYVKYGGLSEIHDIVPYYELQEGTKLAEFAEREKGKLLNRIADGAFEYYCDINNLYNRKDVRRFFKALSKNTGDIISPYKLKVDLSTDESAGSALRDYTVKKYLELLCLNGLAYRVPIYDPKAGKQKLNMSKYYFADVGLAKAFKGVKLGRKQLYLSLICNELMSHEYPLFSALYATSERGEDKKTHRVTKSVDFIVVDNNTVVQAIQVLITDKMTEIKEACHAMKLLGPDCRKTIVTMPDEKTLTNIRLHCPEDVNVVDIITFFIA